MKSFEQESLQLLKFVGGSDNISEVTHCVTRLRFVLKDFEKVHIDHIENLKTVVGTFTGSGQFQVIIGSEVDNFFVDFIKVAGIKVEDKEVEEEEVRNLDQKEKTLMQRIEEKFEEFFSPARK